jgi:hypothetical protein
MGRAGAPSPGGPPWRTRGPTGIESGQTSAPRLVDRREIPPPNATKDDGKRREVSASCALDAPALIDPVEAAVAKAIADAATAGRFDVVAQLARELEARRLARAGNVVLLDAGRRRGGA